MRATDRDPRRWIFPGLALVVLMSACRVPIPAPASPRADLIVSAVGDPPPDGSAGQSFPVPVSVRNSELVLADPSVMRLFLSLDEHVGDADAVVGELSLGAVRAQFAPRKVTITATVPGAIAPGAYRVLACADATNLVNELNESNNCRASAGTISFAPPPPPPGEGSSQDLIAQDLAAGLIDHGTALIYRAWALFWDPRLPARYDGTGSTGEDQALFPAIEAAMPDLPLRATGTAPRVHRAPHRPAQSVRLGPRGRAVHGLRRGTTADQMHGPRAVVPGGLAERQQRRRLPSMGM